MTSISTPDLHRIKTTLGKLGLIESEIEIFLLWLQLGATSIAQLAEQTKMNRITVHEIVGRLIKKWLFLETYAKHRRLVYPNSIDSLLQFVDRKKQEVLKLEHDAQQATSLLRSLQQQSQTLPNTRVYKGSEGIQTIIKEILSDKVSIMILSDGQHFYDLIDNNLLETSLKLRRNKKLRVQLIFPTGFDYFIYTQGTYQQELEIKSLPNEEILHGGITIRGDKMAFHCYEWQFLTTTILHNAAIAKIVGYFFHQTWLRAEFYW